MRLIDADALKELFSEVIGRIAQKPEMNGNLEHMIRASAMVIQMIDDAPSIQQERPKGEWIHQSKFSRIECDQCGKVFRNSFAPKNFCPNCGANMRGEQE